MPIRYYAQRKHIIYSLDTLLYELHTLSFLLAPGLLILLCRLLTQFQFARIRELDGRRGLAFWMGLVVLVNIGGVWSHAFSTPDEDATKSVVLDFVGMGRRPTKFQLLLLDGTIMFLQALLSTISYETSLAHVMPFEVADPLILFPPTNQSASPSPDDTPETAPFIPYSSPDATESAVGLTTYPPSRALTRTPPVSFPSSSSYTSPSSFPTSQQSSSFLSKQPTSTHLPPSTPIIDLTLTHILHRLTSSAPSIPLDSDGRILPTVNGITVSSGSGSGRNPDADMEDEFDDDLAMLRLPLPNTTSVRLAHTLRVIAQARQRRRERERVDARRLRGAGVGTGRHGAAGAGAGVDSAGRGMDGELGRTRQTQSQSQTRGARIPGAIEEDEED